MRRTIYFCLAILIAGPAAARIDDFRASMPTSADRAPQTAPDFAALGLTFETELPEGAGALTPLSPAMVQRLPPTRDGLLDFADGLVPQATDVDEAPSLPILGASLIGLAAVLRRRIG